jgi:biotin synthase
MDEIIQAINNAPAYVKRTCLSMITNGKCRQATLEMTRRLKEETSIPISILISPTILNEKDLAEMKKSGADKIGVAIDLATPELFDKYRGKGVSGPHKWEKYWDILEKALDIFKYPNVGAHLMVGMGETEEQMVKLIDSLWHMGVESHLFSFFAEEGSRLADRPQPPWPNYLRVQLARYIIEQNLAEAGDMSFDRDGHIIDLGLASDLLESVINYGQAFMTTGCSGPDGEVACNRPFGNCLPDVRQWNYPYLPNEEELDLIRQNIFTLD